MADEIRALLGTSSQSFSIGKTNKTTITTGASALDFNKALTINSTPVLTTSNSYSISNKTIDGDSNTIQNLGLATLKTVLGDANKYIKRDANGAVISSTIGAGDLPSNIDASKIADGSVSNTEFQYLDGVTGAIQTQLGNKQPIDATLTALAGLDSTPGFVVETAADTFTKRTIVGTSNRIVVSNGDGVSGNATLDIGTDVVTLTGSQVLTNKTIDASLNTISNLTTAMFATPTIDNDTTLAADSSTRLATQHATKTYVDTAMAGIVGGLIYKGTFDASAGNYNAIVNPKKGWFYKVSISGTIGAKDWVVGDMLIVNVDVTGSPVDSQVDKIDNTESSDIVRLDANQTLTTKTMSGDSNTFTNIGIASLKTVLSDANKFIKRDVNGAVVSATIGTSDIGLDSTPGIVVEVAANTLTKRTLIGESNKIVITNGDGVSGNPTFAIGTDVVTLTGSQVLSNKTIGNTNSISVKDNAFEIVNEATPTKKVAFDVSGVSAATTRTLTVPNKNGTIALTSDITSGVEGVSKTIKVTAGTATVDSTALIPAGSVVMSVRVKVTTVYNAGTIDVLVNGSTPVTVMANTAIFEDTLGVYTAEPTEDIGALNTGKVRVTVAGAASGACEVYVTYLESAIA
jgi:hypothetical protein